MPSTAVLVVLAAIAGFVIYTQVLFRLRSREAHKLVAEGALLLDVRTPEEFRAGHVEGAKNIPVADLQRRVKEVGRKDRPVVVYCRSGARSSQARSVLVANGFEKVLNLGPMSAW